MFFHEKNYLLLGLFCVHIIAMLEHLRVKSVPDNYILKRYTMRAKARETFDRRDYKTESFDGLLFLHQQNELLQIALKVVRTGGKSDDQDVTAKAGLLEVLNRVEAVGSSTAADDDDDACTPLDMNQFEPDLSTEMPRTSHDNDELPSTGCNAQSITKAILPPPISKTKGSKYKNTAESRPTAAGKKMKQEETDLEKDEKTEIGKRKCGICGEIRSGHNPSSCPTKFPKNEKKQLTKKAK